MQVSVVFRSFAVLFVVLAAFFGYTYFTGERQKEDVPYLILTCSTFVMAVAMLILSRNKAFNQRKDD